jgi:hypothetical protein
VRFGHNPDGDSIRGLVGNLDAVTNLIETLQRTIAGKMTTTFAGLASLAIGGLFIFHAVTATNKGGLIWIGLIAFA